MNEVKNMIDVFESLITKDSLLPEEDQKFVKKVIDKNNYYYFEKASKRKVWEVTNGLNYYYINNCVYEKICTGGVEVIYNHLWQALSISFAGNLKWEGQKTVILEDVIEENEFLKKYQEFIKQYQAGYNKDVLNLKLKQLIYDLKVYFLNYSKIKEELLNYQKELEVMIELPKEKKEDNILTKDSRTLQKLLIYQKFCYEFKCRTIRPSLLEKANELSEMVEKSLRDNYLTADEKKTIDEYFQKLKAISLQQKRFNQIKVENITLNDSEKEKKTNKPLNLKLSKPQKFDYLNYKTMKELNNGYFHFDQYYARVSDLKRVLRRLKRRVREYKRVFRKSRGQNFDSFTNDIYSLLKKAKESLNDTQIAKVPYTHRRFYQILRNFSSCKVYAQVQRKISASKEYLKDIKEKMNTITMEKQQEMATNYKRVKRRKFQLKTLFISSVFVFGATTIKNTEFNWSKLANAKKIEKTAKAEEITDLDREMEKLMNSTYRRSKNQRLSSKITKKITELFLSKSQTNNVVSASTNETESLTNEATLPMEVSPSKKEVKQELDVINQNNNEQEPTNNKAVKEVKALPSSKEVEPKPDFVTVNKGDTLSRIAFEKYGDESYYLELADYNNLEDPNQLDIGQTIYFPEEDFARTRKL